MMQKYTIYDCQLLYLTACRTLTDTYENIHESVHVSRIVQFRWNTWISTKVISFSKFILNNSHHNFISANISFFSLIFNNIFLKFDHKWWNMLDKVIRQFLSQTAGLLYIKLTAWTLLLVQYFSFNSRVHGKWRW